MNIVISNDSIPLINNHSQGQNTGQVLGTESDPLVQCGFRKKHLLMLSIPATPEKKKISAP
jgi:hypothetical protein